MFERLYGDCSGIFGKPVEELAGRRVTEVLSRDRARAWISRFSRALAGETLSLRERTGDTVWNISIFPVREGRRSVATPARSAREISDWNKAENDLRQTVLGALKSQEFERKMASKFLHDTVGQNLTALGMQLDLVRMDFEEAAPEACARIGEIQKVLETIMEDVRDYSYELNPSTVERAGLRPALDRLVDSHAGAFQRLAAPERGSVSQARPERGPGALSNRAGGHRKRRASIPVAPPSKSR